MLRSNRLSYVANGAHCPRLAYRCQPQIIDKFTFYQAVRLRHWRIAQSLISEPAADLSTARTVLAGLSGDAGKSASAGCSAAARWPINQESTLRARDDFDDLRAERDMPTHYRNEPNRFAGLWKQIAIGIVVGYGVLGIVSAVVWMIIARAMLGDLSITLP